VRKIFIGNTVAFVVNFVTDALTWLVTQVRAHFSWQGSLENGFGELFDRAVLVKQAFVTFDRLDEPLEVIRPSQDQLMVTQRWLIVRSITHEFHHGGQLLMLGRALGPPLPEDIGTDLVLP
jgi:uncharacterized damage-inducible protein DinB